MEVNSKKIIIAFLVVTILFFVSFILVYSKNGRVVLQPAEILIDKAPLVILCEKSSINSECRVDMQEFSQETSSIMASFLYAGESFCESRLVWYYSLNGVDTEISGQDLELKRGEQYSLILRKNLDSGWLLGKYNLRINSVNGCISSIDKPFEIKIKELRENGQ